jgi:hypothetical protein
MGEQEKTIREKWIEALESDKYRQCVRYLRRKVDGIDCHCATGVLADIIDPKGWNNDEFLGWYWHGWHQRITLSLHLVGAGTNREEVATVERMNDCGEYFTTIAKWLREKMPT